jgi:hypothetical protein
VLSGVKNEGPEGFGCEVEGRRRRCVDGRWHR